MLRPRTVILLTCLFLLVLCFHASAQPSVRFAATQYHITEHYRDAWFQLIITDPPTDMALPVFFYVSGGTATELEDYSVDDNAAWFYPGGSDTISGHVQIWEDSFSEGPETIELTINDGAIDYVVGSPNRTTITIIDDDPGTPTAHFELDQDIPLAPDGSIAVVAAPEVEVTIDVVVDDLPPEGATVHYTSTADGLIHTLVFASNPRQTIVMQPAAIPPGLEYSVNTLQILNPVGRKSTTSDSANRGSVSSQEEIWCVSCFIQLLFVVIEARTCEQGAYHCGFVCPPLAEPDGLDLIGKRTRASNGAEEIETLQRYRDEVLSGAPGGEYYIRLYQDYSPAIATAILQRPTLIHRVLVAWDLWLPAVAAQVDGQGANFTITGEMQSALSTVMTGLADVGSADLAQLLADFRLQLDLDNIAGATVADLQAAIETNPMPTRSATWGGVKALYKGSE